jgi:hypothetical protein
VSALSSATTSVCTARASSRLGVLTLAGVGMAGGAWLLRGVDASTGIGMPCVFHLLTGLHCPGCGLTRALHALAQGDVARAWAMHPLLLLALPLVAAMLLQWASRRAWLPMAVQRRVSDGATWIVVLLAFGVLRNLPWPAFAWMAPG